MDKSIILEKIAQAQTLLQKNDIDLWMIFVRESTSNPDPMLPILVGADVTWQSAFLIPRNGTPTAIVGSLEYPGHLKHGVYQEVISYVKGVKEPLTDYLKKLQPRSIALNYSVNSNLADGLSYGMWQTLTKILSDAGLTPELLSSEGLVASLRGVKSRTEVDNMRKAIEVTEKIFDEVTAFLKPGLTEKDVSRFILGRIASYGLVPAWDEEHCPAVYTGPEIEGAHSGPTDRVIEPGHIMNIDFGVKYNEYCSDMQRTWYFMKPGETEVPAEVIRGFNVIRDSIRMAGEGIKPGVQGCSIDAIARGYITSNGYDEYQHGLGHQVGRAVHDGGAGLFPEWERYGNTPYIPLEAGQVFTIEPRLMVKGYGVATVEEMVHIGESGIEYLSHPQQEIWVIPNR